MSSDSESDDNYTPEVPEVQPKAEKPQQIVEVEEEHQEQQSQEEKGEGEEEEEAKEEDSASSSSNPSSSDAEEKSPVQYSPPTFNSVAEANAVIDVALFNKIITYYLSSSLSQDPDFQQLSPEEKSQKLLKTYNEEHKTNILPHEVNLNFNATTSYNKTKLRHQDTEMPLVPMNPYCHRPDINSKMPREEYGQWQKFLQDESKYHNEYNCMVFPAGSRLFIGNLAVNTLVQKDVWRVFRPYGDIAAVNMKQGFGFVQFKDNLDCDEAIKGETNVPLHNRLMELQVSKTHSKHKEMKAEGLDPLKANKKSDVFHPDILILLTPDPDAGFNSLLVNTLQESKIQCEIKHVETDADNIDQELISQAAYGGKSGIIITREGELVDLMLFSKDSSSNKDLDGSSKNDAIRFDNYESISMESAIGWINEHTKKQQAKLKQSQPRQRDTRNSGNSNNSHNNRNTYRDRSDTNHRRDDRERPRREGGNQSRYNNYRYHNDKSSSQYSESEQYNQKREPPVVPGNTGYHSYQPPPQDYHHHHQAPPPNSYYPPPPQAYPGYTPQGYYQPPPPQGGYYGQQQQYYPPPALPPQGMYSQPPYGVQYPSQPGALPGMTTSPGPQPVVPGTNAIGGVLNQLQQQPQQPQQHSQPQQKPAPADDSTTALFETLARLKNNM